MNGNHPAYDAYSSHPDLIPKEANNLVDVFVLDVKKISEIQADEFHVSSLSYGNEKDLTDKVLKDADKYVDKNFVKSQADGLSLLSGKVVINSIDDVISKKVLKNITKYDKKLGKAVEYPMYNNVALGKDLNGTLETFGKEAGANVWTAKTDNVFTSMYDLMGSRSFERNISDVLNQTIKNEGKILFDIASVNIQKAIDGGLIHNTKLVFDDRLVTELELQLILRNPSWFENTVFHIKGRLLSNDELINAGIRSIK